MGANIDKPLRVAAYARVSTDKDDQLNSFESQLKYFSEQINNQPNWSLVEVYSDEGITGTSTRKRDGFNRMISDALSGKIDAILTKSVSRFARNTLDSISYIRQLMSHSIFVIFLTDGIDTREADAELRLTIMAALAQDESRRISEYVKWGQTQKMKQGVVFGRSLLGYRVEKGKLYLIEEEAEIVRMIFHKYLEGKGAHIIARELTESGIIPYGKTKSTWSTTAILRILRNEKYVGDLCQKKTYTKNYLDHKKHRNDGQEEMIYIKNHHPEIAIITRDIWNAVQQELLCRSQSIEKETKYSNRYWASGKIFCGVCGEKYISRTRKTKNGTYHAWSCSNHTKSVAFRTKTCDISEWLSDRSIKQIIRFLLSILLDDKTALMDSIMENIQKLNFTEATESADKIQQKLNRLSQKKLRLIDMYLSNELTKQEFTTKKEQLDTEFQSLSNRKKQASKFQNKWNKNESIAFFVERILNFQDEDIDLLLETLIHKITVFDNHLVEVILNLLPFRFQFHYRSTGKLETYRTEIHNFQIKKGL